MNTPPEPMDISTDGSSRFTTDFDFESLGPIPESQPPVSDFYRRYLNIVETATTGNKIMVQESFSHLISLELGLIANELQHRPRCTLINNIQIPGGVRNLQKLIDEQAQNPVLFTWLFCSFETAFNTPTLKTVKEKDQYGGVRDTVIITGYDTNIPVVRKVISEIKGVISTGMQGDVWKAVVLGNENVAMLKTYKNRESANYIGHEFFVGYQLNKLRSEVPNFMYVYGMFRCQTPGPASKFRQVCPNPITEFGYTDRDDRDYLIMEVIKPSVGFGSMVNFGSIAGRLKVDQLMALYIQVVAASAVAFYRLGFTHYDLNESNVLVQDTNGRQEYYIPYFFEGFTLYIKTRLISKIVDYGMSHVVVQDNINGVPTGKLMNFGNLRYTARRVHPFAPSRFHDIYKLAGQLLYVLKNGKQASTWDSSQNSPPNPDLFRQVHHLITRFPPFNNLPPDQDPTGAAFGDMFNSEAQEGFSYESRERDPLVTNTPFSSHIKYLLEKYPQLKGTVCFGSNCVPPGAKILDCNNLQCSNWNEIEALVRAPK